MSSSWGNSWGGIWPTLPSLHSGNHATLWRLLWLFRLLMWGILVLQDWYSTTLGLCEYSKDRPCQNASANRAPSLASTEVGHVKRSVGLILQSSGTGANAYWRTCAVYQLLQRDGLQSRYLGHRMRWFKQSTHPSKRGVFSLITLVFPKLESVFSRIS